jgi:hypothetical protein
MHRTILCLVALGAVAGMVAGATWKFVGSPPSVAAALAAEAQTAGEAAGPSTPPETPVEGPEKWALAVVFERQGDGRRFRGILEEPRVPAAGGSAAAGLPQGPAEFEVWLLADGHTRGFAYSPGERTYQELPEEGAAPEPMADDGALARIVGEARPRALRRPLPDTPPAVACGVPVPDTLVTLCRDSKVIAVGRVAGILREAHTPVGTNGPHQHTVYAFAVEEYLKNPEPVAPPVVKVWQQGGPLPWSFDRFSGVGWRMGEDPMLNVGDRYCLFLRRGADRPGEHRRRGYVTGSRPWGHGKISELDEYGYAHIWRGKLLLGDGLSRAPGIDHPPYYHWAFETGPQIVGVSEAEALAAIREEVARQAAE